MVYGLWFFSDLSDLSDLSDFSDWSDWSLDEAVFEAEEVEDSVEADG